MTGANPYKSLMERFRTWLFNLPESNDLMPMFMERYDPEEAELLARFPFTPSSMGDLSERLNSSPDDLEQTMAPMIRKGFICEFQGRRGKRYSLADQIFAFYRMPGWRGEDDEKIRKLAPMMNRYYSEQLGPDFMGHPTKGLRALPIAQTIKDPRQILPYEDVLDLVDREELHAVSTCACRHRHNLDPKFETCSYETEVCLHFGKLAHYTIEHGMGRRIEPKETLDILQYASKAGLVHAASNSKKGVDTVCNCCSCCCLFLEPLTGAARILRGHQRSNYALEIDRETCKACGLCAKRCPVKAVELVDKADAPTSNPKSKPRLKDIKEVAYNSEACIGCGVCAHTCPTGSLKLVRRSETEEDIPETLSDLGRRFLMERGRDFTKIF